MCTYNSTSDSDSGAYGIGNMSANFDSSSFGKPSIHDIKGAFKQFICAE